MNAKKQKNDASAADVAEQGFTIVAVGASAGGLEAISELLKHLPDDSGMAFVVVQHLDPVRESMLTDILKRTTEIPVCEISDGLRVERNHVYIIPPGCYLGILHGVLQLLPYPEASRHSPIDHFMQTLAEDQGSKAIGVILSGTGSDGSLGLKAIKTANGITFAQDEESAAYAGMPSSALSAGVVDRVLSPSEIAKELVQIGHYPHKQYLASSVEKIVPELDDDYNKILILLRSRSGHDFAHYKQTTIKRRIKRRMLLQRLENLNDYIKLMQASKAEVDALFQDILINVTGFFRDPQSFEALQQQVFPQIINNNRESDSPIRIWVPACSSGEEAYSVAMALLEYMGDMSITLPIQIFASDIDDQAIEQARKGIYPEKISEQVAAPRLKRFFVKVTGGYQISKSIRDLCVFAEQDITKDPPFSRLDLICCRNLLIYFSAVLQKKVFQVFHYALQPSGYLFLGNSESIGSHAELFLLVDKKHKIYSKKSVAVRPGYDFTVRPSFPDTSFILPAHRDSAVTIRDLQNEADQLVLNRYGPPGVIINEHLDILHFRGNTSPYISPIPGVASLNLLKMARQDLVMELRSLVAEVTKKHEAVERQGVDLRHNGQHQLINLQVIPLAGSLGSERCLLVLIEPQAEVLPSEARRKDKAPVDIQDKRYEELERELLNTREYMQSIIEDQEASTEELKSANEEIQSANEELQSTNEELETAKEELQSTNEELATVNDELESRNHELSNSNNDLANLLVSINQPILMLSSDLKIRRFTPSAMALLNLIDTDIGRPIGNLRPNVDISGLESTCLEVIEHMTPYSSEVRGQGDRWHSLRIRPYITEDKRIDGVIVTLIDITDIKQAEQLRMNLAEKERLATVVRDSNDAIIAVDLDGEIMALNPGAERLYGYTETEALGKNIAFLIPEAERKHMQQMLGEIGTGNVWPPFEAIRLTKDGRELRVFVTASALVNAQGKIYGVSMTELNNTVQPEIRS